MQTTQTHAEQVNCVHNNSPLRCYMFVNKPRTGLPADSS